MLGNLTKAKGESKFLRTYGFRKTQKKEKNVIFSVRLTCEIIVFDKNKIITSKCHE